MRGYKVQGQLLRGPFFPQCGELTDQLEIRPDLSGGGACKIPAPTRQGNWGESGGEQFWRKESCKYSRRGRRGSWDEGEEGSQGGHNIDKRSDSTYIV
jgi:hypothetical protein